MRLANGMIINLLEPGPYPPEHEGEHLLLVSDTARGRTHAIWLSSRDVREAWETFGAAVQSEVAK